MNDIKQLKDKLRQLMCCELCEEIDLLVSIIEVYELIETPISELEMKYSKTAKELFKKLLYDE